MTIDSNTPTRPARDRERQMEGQNSFMRDPGFVDRHGVLDNDDTEQFKIRGLNT